MRLLQSNFKLTKNSEIAIECNPSYLDFPDINQLAEIGFNRISLGVQDTQERVLLAVNRRKSKHPLKDLISYIKGKKISVNIDLIYGLPLQTVKSFIETVKEIVEYKPNRIVTFSYAHIPSLKPAQKALEVYGLPSANEKLEMLINSGKEIELSGYTAIGFDHYALPEDDLTHALKNRQLHRNFQGYCTRETTGDVYAIGATAISQWPNGYFQSIKTTSDYIHQIHEGQWACWRGYILNDNEKLIGNVIKEILCNQYLDWKMIAHTHKLTIDKAKDICNFKETLLIPMIEDGLLEYSKDILNVNPSGRLFLRNIAMLFDPLLEQNSQNYSRTV